MPSTPSLKIFTGVGRKHKTHNVSAHNEDVTETVPEYVYEIEVQVRMALRFFLVIYIPIITYFIRILDHLYIIKI